jgi:Nif-specific regulatory protein
MSILIEGKLSEIREIRKEQFDALYQISEILNSTLLEEELVERSLDIMINSIHAERGLFVKYDGRKNHFTIVVARNIRQEKIDDISAFSSGILQQVISQKKPCLYHDVQSDPDISQFKSIQIQQIKSVIGVPIIYQGKIWGVILADSQVKRKEFTEENLLFLQFFSNLVSLSLNRIIHLESLSVENEILRNQLQNIRTIPEIIGESAAMKKFAALVHRVAQTDATVLILGESGTGKDLAARAIHQLSLRKNKPYLAQFCGSIPDSLLESELFGYKKGAFTGAHTDKKGLFEVADQGTFFLDEIADISFALQGKLLRVVQNQEIIRLGDTRVQKVDVRLIAATNKDLKKLTGEGKFREDLYYRLNVFPITIPPLRERITDISLLVDHFIKKYSNRPVKIEPGALKKLEKYSWPGNVRQLENTIQRALILCDHHKLTKEHIVLEEIKNEQDMYVKGKLKDFENYLLQKRLESCNNNKSHAAKSLGVSLRWVQMRLKEIQANIKREKTKSKR